MTNAAFGGPTYPTFSRLVGVQTALWRDIDVRLRKRHAIPLPDVTVLQVIADMDGCRVQDLATTLHITVGGASKIVDRLVEGRLASRAPNPNDRRSSVLAVTREGHELLVRVSPDVESVLDVRLAGAVDPAHLTLLDEALRQLERGAGHNGDESPQQEPPRQEAPDD